MTKQAGALLRVTQSQPPAGHKEPDHIAECTQGARSQIASSPELTPVHGLGAEGWSEKQPITQHERAQGSQRC